MTATLTALGAGSILPRAGHGCSGYALEAEPGGLITLLDCGPGSLRALGEAGLALERVRRLVFSHYHLDHCLDLYALAFARHNPRMPAPPEKLAIHGPEGLVALHDQAPAIFGEWARDPNAELFEVELDADGHGGFEAPATGGEPGARFRCVRNGHSSTRVTLSWRVDVDGGGSLLYTGDTNDDARVAELGRGVDVFLAECSHPDALAQPSHLTPSSAARLARDAGAKRLVLTHFYPDNDPHEARAQASEIFGGRVEVARDGYTVQLA